MESGNLTVQDPPWTAEIQRLDRADALMSARLSELEASVHQAKNAARSAADTALEVKAALGTLETRLLNAMADLTSQLIRVIASDRHQDEQLSKFERVLEQKTSQATESIRVQAVSQTNTMQRRVVIPIGLISSIFVIIEWAVRHFK